MTTGVIEAGVGTHTFGPFFAVESGSTNPYTFLLSIAQDETLLVIAIVTPGATWRQGGAPTFQGQPLTLAARNEMNGGLPCVQEVWYLEHPPSDDGIAGGPVGGTVSIPNTFGPLALYIKACTARSSTGATKLFWKNTTTYETNSEPSMTSFVPVAGSLVVAALVMDLPGGSMTEPAVITGTAIDQHDESAYGMALQYVIPAAPGDVTMGWTLPPGPWRITMMQFTPVKHPTVIATRQQVSVGDGMSTGDKVR